MPSSPPLTVAQASKQTGRPRRTIQHAIARGELRAEKLGDNTSAYLIQQRDLDKWVADRDTKAVSA